MSARIHSALAVLVVSVSFCRGGESAFYHTFMHSVNSNDLTQIVWVRSPLLVDTNNSALKVAGMTNSFTAMKEQGVISRIHLGMTMSEVVAEWGKPPRFVTKCGGGPFFAYPDVGLYFHGDSLWKVYVPAGGLDGFFAVGQSYAFESGLSSRSRIQDIVRVLGEPTRQTSDARAQCQYCVYESPKHALIVGFDLESGIMSRIALQAREGGELITR